VTAAADPLDILAASATRHETPMETGALVWHEWGQGPPLVLLHGGAGSWRHWARNIGLLARDWRVLAPDMPGLGESATPPTDFDLWSYARLITAGLDHLIGPTARYDLAGFSFGGVISGHIAALDARSGHAHSRPGRLRSFTLVGAGGLGLRRDPVALSSVRSKQGEARTAAHRENLAALMIADPAKIDALALRIQAWNSDHARLRSPRLVPDGSLRNAVAEATAPLNVLYGERDAIVYPYMDERVALFHAMRPEVRMHIIPEAGHWVAFEAAEAFNPLFCAVLKR
jgi:pimeloyl-ACP methyl ester carboxylesterase